MPWQKLGEGTFNTVYVNDDKRCVLKIPKDVNQSDAPERAVRLWNELNPDFGPAYVNMLLDCELGWICPYIEGRQASDEVMQDALIHIFNRTGRIVVDAVCPKNFVRMKDGRIICIDIGMALQLQQQEELLVQGGLRRSNSQVSLDTWNSLQLDYTKYFEDSKKVAPRTVETIKALLFLKRNYPDIYEVTFLKSQPDFIQTLAKNYDAAVSIPQKEELLDLQITRGSLLPQFEQRRGSGHQYLKVGSPPSHDGVEPPPKRFRKM